MSAWIALIVASLLTLAFKAGPSLVNGGVALPERLQRANRFVPPALMGAVVSRNVAAQAAATGGAAILAAVALAALVARRTRSIALTVAAGTTTYLALSALLSRAC